MLSTVPKNIIFSNKSLKVKNKVTGERVNDVVQFGQSDQSEQLKVIEDYFDDWDSWTEDGKNCYVVLRDIDVYD